MMRLDPRSEESSRPTSDPSTSIARAPGKITLSGEHFVVLGTPAIAMAINLYSRVQVTPKNGSGVDVNADIPLRFLAGKPGNPLVPDPRELLRPLQLAAEATLKHIGSGARGVHVNVECEIPVAAGLGSSASTTVAIIAAVAKSEAVELNNREIFKFAFVPENFLDGEPSAVDQATCIYGGMISFNRPSSLNPLRPKGKPTLLACDTGMHNATRTLVGGVVQKSQKERKDVQNYLV